MTNLLLLALLLLIVVSLIQVILLMIYKEIYSRNKDEYIRDLSILERVIDDYVEIVLKKKIQTEKKNYNLDPSSRINSILSFEKKINQILSDSSVEILKMLSRKTSKNLRKRFSNNSLALLIINRIKQSLI